MKNMKQKGLARGGLALAGAAVIGGLAYLISTIKMEELYKTIHQLQWVDVTRDGIDEAIVVLPNTPDRLPSVGENINQRIYAIDGSKTFQDPHGNWRAKTNDYIILGAKGNLDLLQGLFITPEPRDRSNLGALPINARAYRASNGEFESFKFTSQGEGR